MGAGPGKHFCVEPGNFVSIMRFYVPHFRYKSPPPPPANLDPNSHLPHPASVPMHSPPSNQNTQIGSTCNTPMPDVHSPSRFFRPTHQDHYNDVIMGAIASQITSLTIVLSIVYSDADHRKHQSSASLAFVGEFTGDRWIPRTNGQ